MPHIYLHLFHLNHLHLHQARAAGTVGKYEEEVKALQEAYQVERNRLKSPDAGLRQTLIKICKVKI